MVIYIIKEADTLSKNNCHNCHLSQATIRNSLKRQKINEIRYFKSDRTR